MRGRLRRERGVQEAWQGPLVQQTSNQLSFTAVMHCLAYLFLVRAERFGLQSSLEHTLLAVDYKPYDNRNKGFSVLSFSTTYYWLAIKLLLPCRWPVIDHLLAVCWSYIDVILAIHRLRLTAQIAEKSEDLEIKML